MTKATARTGASTRPASRKSQTAPRTIEEVSEELDVAVHVLRFWESKFPQLRPLKRGRGERHYRPEDVDFLRHIRWLLYEEGYTIKGAQKLLRRQREHPDESDNVDREASVMAASTAETAEDLTQTDWLQAELIVLRREAKARAASLDAMRSEVEAACDRLLAC